jgi:hypothetical protein
MLISNKLSDNGVHLIKCIEGNIDRYIEFKRLFINYEMARSLIIEYMENYS